MIYSLKFPKKQLRFIKSAVVNEQKRMFEQQKLLDENDDEYSDITNDAMLYETIINYLNRVLNEDMPDEAGKSS
jgi:hypothetical protein